MEKKSRQW